MLNCILRLPLTLIHRFLSLPLVVLRLILWLPLAALGRLPRPLAVLDVMLASALAILDDVLAWELATLEGILAWALTMLRVDSILTWAMLKETTIVDNYPSQLSAFQKRDWVAAHILYTNHIFAALAGPPAAAFYGPDTLWTHSMLLINDSDFEDACSVLHANGYQDLPTDQCDYETLQSPHSDDDPDAGKKDSVRWRTLSPSERTSSGGGTILIPASHWYFRVTDDTTIIVDGIRFPKFSSYLHALVSLIGQRVQSRIPAGYYESQALSMWILRKRYPKSMTEISPATRFFLEHFFSVRRTNNRRKVTSLWDGLNQGNLTVEEAVALVPIETPVKYRRNDFPVVSLRLDGK